SALDGRTQSLLKTITDEKTLNKDLSNFNIDLQRLPAGQFSLKQIHESFQVLSDIAKVAGQKAYVAGFRGQRAKDAQSKKEFQKLQERLFDLNNRFYEIIPHDFGERRPTVIESKEAIREKFDMLQVMSDVTEAMGCVEEDLLKEARLSGKSKVDVVYEGLGAQIVPLEDGELQHKMVHDYILKTAERSVKVKNLFQVRRYEEVSSFAPFVGLRPSNVLLWHGSRVSNIAGILSRGLLIAPPEAPQTGLMFGKGVYFADTFEKSANYTGWSDVRYMLLCEVALGQSACLTYARYMEKPLHGSDSTKGVGQRSPDRSEWLVRTAASEGGFGDDCLPAAPIKTQHVSGFATLGRNEYIVYDTSRIRIRYLVEFE
ncbi:poly polymerase catalytic domain-containing protein, partial [Zopfochytrium polystomum]